MEVEFTFRGLRPPPREPGMMSVQCEMCRGEGAVFVPRLGISSDGSNGTIHAPMDCRPCKGLGWIPWPRPADPRSIREH